ncbi:hypothetical protein JAAARDRAFT_686428 [Jaapia argillacea MUCL 33604]|uniref:Uncharacterized protein n=1 Tax=Jaapia argillacea MUCL 33604 TaxID=933084 RepID=A0A067P2D6_9AGAM|nr:hypothetical protein JAAARDRAFT_686428 [Jaapia argillacea MUCL 33604]
MRTLIVSSLLLPLAVSAYVVFTDSLNVVGGCRNMTAGDIIQLGWQVNGSVADDCYVGIRLASNTSVVVAEADGAFPGYIPCNASRANITIPQVPQGITGGQPDKWEDAIYVLEVDLPAGNGPLAESCNSMFIGDVPAGPPVSNVTGNQPSANAPSGDYKFSLDSFTVVSTLDKSYDKLNLFVSVIASDNTSLSLSQGVSLGSNIRNDTSIPLGCANNSYYFSIDPNDYRMYTVLMLVTNTHQKSVWYDVAKILSGISMVATSVGPLLEKVDPEVGYGVEGGGLLLHLLASALPGANGCSGAVLAGGMTIPQFRHQNSSYSVNYVNNQFAGCQTANYSVNWSVAPVTSVESQCASTVYASNSPTLMAPTLQNTMSIVQSLVVFMPILLMMASIYQFPVGKLLSVFFWEHV